MDDKKLPPLQATNRVLLVVILLLASMTVYLLDSNQKNSDQLTKANASIAALQAQILQTSSSPSTTDSTATQATSPIPAVTANDHILGSLDAPVVMVVYTDLECPFCKQFHSTMKQITTDYNGKVAWVFRHFPLSFHQNAPKEAEAAECAGSQGGDTAFWKYTDAIMDRTTSNGTGFALDKLEPLASEIGLDPATFAKCLNGDQFASRIKANQDSGTASGVRGTPYTFAIAKKDGSQTPINGALPIAEVKTIIDGLLK